LKFIYLFFFKKKKKEEEKEEEEERKKEKGPVKELKIILNYFSRPIL
jgi:hypothetical protein